MMDQLDYLQKFPNKTQPPNIKTNKIYERIHTRTSWTDWKTIVVALTPIKMFM